MPSTIISESPLVAEYTKVSSSTSLADKSIIKDVSSSIVWFPIEEITGESFTGFTETLNVVCTLSLLFNTSLADTITSPEPYPLGENVNVKSEPTIWASTWSKYSITLKDKSEPFSTS